MRSMEKLRHIYRHGWSNTDTYRSVDRILVDRLGRPDRQTRYQNRSQALDEGLSAALFGASFAIGTGRVRAGKTAVKVGSKTIRSVGWDLSMPMFARTRGRRAMEAVPKLIGAARGINSGLRTKRQGRILQTIGLGGLIRQF